MCAEQGGRDRTDPCKEHQTIPRWMRIQWARATRLLAGTQDEGWEGGTRPGKGCRKGSTAAPWEPDTMGRGE